MTTLQIIIVTTLMTIFSWIIYNLYLMRSEEKDERYK